MRRDIKLIISMLFNFIFALSATGSVFFYSLLGTVAMDRLCIIITEATGFQRQEQMLTGILSPALIQNIFWLSIAGAAFCILTIYLLHNSSHPLWAPATISILLFLLLNMTKNFLYTLLPSEVNELVSTPYIILTLERFSMANYALLLFGIALCLLAYFGDRIKQDKQVTG